MNVRNKRVIAWLLVPVLIAGCRTHEPMMAIAQSVLAHDDVIFMTQTILENHPGPKNSLDPSFMKVLNEAHEKALAESANVRSECDHIKMLENYSRHFHDAHLGAVSKARCEEAQQLREKERVGGKDFSLREWMPKCLWVTVPTFEPEGEKRVEQMNAIIEKLPQYRDYRCIIFDVRGNTGGNSRWGAMMLAALCGQDYCDYKRNKWERDVYVEWRLSAGNLEHMHRGIDGNKGRFNSQDLEQEEKLYNDMVDAFDRGAALFAEYPAVSEKSDDVQAAPKNKCHAKIIAIIDRRCGSACLGFLDELRMIEPPALFVGQTTGADSLYMDVRRVELPSGIGYLVIPMKVYRNRPRGHNQPYHPNIAYAGDLNDTVAVEEWLKQEIVKFLK
jgi:hypothetical protein